MKISEVGAGVLVTAQPTFANPFPITASDHAQDAASAPEAARAAGTFPGIVTRCAGADKCRARQEH
jgi:hypothetical protein